MKHRYRYIIQAPRFVTIWIFARMKLTDEELQKLQSFVTIWIFARMKHKREGDND